MNTCETEMGLLQSKRKIFFSVLMVATILLGKLFFAYRTNSLALFSDSWHLVTDLASLVISWLGLKYALKPANDKYTFGHYRHGILTALINNLLLIFISLFIFYQAFLRYLNPIRIEPTGMILISILGLAINCLIVFILKENANNLNVKSAFLHFAGDALADIGVLIGGVIIYFTGWTGIDTLLSAILACLILKSAVAMTIECIQILLEATPKNTNIKKIRNSMKSIDGVIDVTDIHVWSLSAEIMSLTAHVCIKRLNIKECEEILHMIQHLLIDNYGIKHSTLQFEHAPCSSCFHSKKEHLSNCIMCIDSSRRKNIATLDNL
ncbi:MAG: cation diffusion facilitator family transporter [Desulfitobacterium hafniense]|nr:cation diffusion facilitator family transporter [Desulfitobacterium hafniense]